MDVQIDTCTEYELNDLSVATKRIIVLNDVKYHLLGLCHKSSVKGVPKKLKYLSQNGNTWSTVLITTYGVALQGYWRAGTIRVTNQP